MSKFTSNFKKHELSLFFSQERQLVHIVCQINQAHILQLQFLRFIVIINFHLWIGFPSVLFSSGLRTNKILYSYCVFVFSINKDNKDITRTGISILNNS
jgi:hypothetical protein